MLKSKIKYLHEHTQSLLVPACHAGRAAGEVGMSYHFREAPKGEVSSQDVQACLVLSSWGQILRRAVPAFACSALSNSDELFIFVLDGSLLLSELFLWYFNH